MKKGDKGKKVFGAIVILAIVVSVFGGVVSAEDVSEDFTGSVADAEIRGAVVSTSSSSDLPVTGKGIWIWKIWELDESVSEIIDKLQNAGVEWVTIKCGDSNSYYPDHGYMYNWLIANGYSDFGEVVTQFHDAGIKVFGWHFVYSESKYSGTGYSSEADVSNKILSIQGIDGLIINAEGAYEGEDKGPIAEQYMQDIRVEHPNSFIAYSTFARIDSHLWFPYIEFGRYCDAVMPQAYWKDRPTTPQNEVDIMKQQWDKWHAIWESGGYGDSKKPIIPTGQSWSDVYQCYVSGSEITEFCNAVYDYGYEGINLFRYGKMTDEIWEAYATCGGEPSPVITSSLTIIQSPPYYVGDTITGQFTIANRGTTPITFANLTIGGRDPDDQVADFTHEHDITLNPSESHNYQETLDLTKAGNYHFFCAYKTPEGSWCTSIPTEGGATNVLDITVEAHECDGTDTSCGIYPNCENCNDHDGCYAYGNGCEERDYYCRSNEEGCDYTYSNRHTDYYDDWVYYCSGDIVRRHRLFHNYYCDGGTCTDHPSWIDVQLVENCNDHDGWVDTGNTKWVNENECQEKEQKEQEYRDYSCSGGACTYSVTGTQWIDTGNTREKPDSGVFRNGRWILRSCNPSGAELCRFKFGRSTDIPVTGDWNGDGVDTIGVYRNGRWLLRNSNSAGPPDYSFKFGRSTDIPVTGDWDGDGVDTIGVRRNKTWLLRNSNSAGPVDYRFRFGRSTDIPVTDDWNGDGIDTIGVRRDKQWRLRDSNSAGPSDYKFRFGRSTDIPVTGDWNNDGIDTIGVHRNRLWILRDSNSAGSPDYSFKFGRSTDVPVTGGWDGT